MIQNKVYKFEASAKHNNIFSFTEDIKGCPASIAMSINENGKISLNVDGNNISGLAYEMGVYVALQSTNYGKVRRCLIKKLYSAYTEDDYLTTFYKKTPTLEYPSTLDVSSLYNNALEKKINAISLLQKEADSIIMKRYERQLVDVTIDKRKTIEELLRKEAVVKLSWGIFKPSQSKIDQYVREHITPIILELNKHGEEIFDLAERIEDSKEIAANAEYKADYDSKIEAINAKIKAVESQEVSLDYYKKEDFKALGKAMDNLLSTNIEWPVMFSLQYNYNQAEKNIICYISFPKIESINLIPNYVIFKNKELFVYRKSKEMLESDYNKVVCSVCLYIASIILNSHQYIKLITFHVNQGEASENALKIYREGIVHMDYTNSSVSDCFQSIISNKEFSFLSYPSESSESNTCLGCSIVQLTTSSTALDRYLEWLQKQNDVLTMRGVKEHDLRTVQVTDAFLQKRYMGIMSENLYNQTLDGIPQLIKKDDLLRLEYQRNLLTYRSKLQTDCEKLIEKASTYEAEGKMNLAIKYYERCIEYGCEEALPYNRLMDIYQKSSKDEDRQRILSQKDIYAATNKCYSETVDVTPLKQIKIDNCNSFSALDNDYTQLLDPLLCEAANLLVVSQQTSVSLIQRKFAIGIIRANRILEQLEHYGIVGPSINWRPRSLLIHDIIALNMLLKDKGLQ